VDGNIGFGHTNFLVLAQWGNTPADLPGWFQGEISIAVLLFGEYLK